MRRVAILAGEASGDRIAALAARALVARDTELFGIGGPACAAAGVELVGDGVRAAAMGLADVARAAPALAALVAGFVDAVKKRRPAAAVLVNFTELNAWIGRWLRSRGVHVVWCVPPQVWAWRPGRLESLRGALDRMAVVLPFEEALWRDAGHDARYVGHPALEVPAFDRIEARRLLGLPADGRAVAVLPGSRPGEIRRLAGVLLEAATRLVNEGAASDVRVFAAPGLAPQALEALHEACVRHELQCLPSHPEHGAAPWLTAFDATLTASGTASLEAALAGATPIVAAKLDPLAYWLARRLVRTPHVALPNVLLGRRVFAELVQDEVNAPALEREARRALAAGGASAGLAAELRALLDWSLLGGFGDRVAELVGS